MSILIKCPYCNREVEGDSIFCSKCGKEIKKNILEQSDNIKNESISTQIKIPKNNSGVLGKSIIVIGIISCILLFSAGFQIKKGAVPMETITSQAGNTIAEEYYQKMGQVLEGFSYLCYGLGVGILGLSINAGKKYN